MVIRTSVGGPGPGEGTSGFERRQRRSRLAASHSVEVLEQHRRRLMTEWLDSVPGAYTGRTVAEDLQGDHWGGRLRRPAVRTLIRYLDYPTRFLLLKGEKGLGKSTLGVTIATELMKRYHTQAVYRSLPTLLMSFSFARDSDPLGECSAAPVLILDDVGAAAETVTDHQMRCLWALVDARWANTSLCTILTTNMAVASTTDGQGLIDWFGPSAWDRIQHDLTLVDFQGESLRS